MKIDKQVAAIFAAGVIIGDLLARIATRQRLKELRNATNRNYDLYAKEVERSNGIVEENTQLRTDLANCKITNWQVAQYAASLKQQLDRFME